MNANEDAGTYSDCEPGIGNDTIYFDDALGAASVLINTDHSLPYITDPDGLTIFGGGDITLMGAGGSYGDWRVFFVNSGASLILDSIQVTNGFSVGSGGAIYMYPGSSLTIQNSTIANNGTRSYQDSGGGAVFNNGGILVIRDSVFSNNEAGYGGGVFSTGALSITHSTFYGNNGYYGGGAVMNQWGTMDISSSTFANNWSYQGYGGAVYNRENFATITNSTFSNNSTHWIGRGGAVYNNGYNKHPGSLTITNSTFSGNSTETQGYGGGIYNDNGATLNLYNSIIANSRFGLSGSGGDCVSAEGSPFYGSHNLIEDSGSACSLVNGVNGNIVGIDPKLGKFADHMKKLPTTTASYSLLAGSRAINGGDDNICTSSPVNGKDQRGQRRPQFEHCDIGSYEINERPPLILVYGLQKDTESDEFNCDFGIEPYEVIEGVNNSHLGKMPAWFEEMGYDVRIAHITTSKKSTPSLEKNADCLAEQINKVFDENSQPITIIAHSMGGIVSQIALKMIDDSSETSGYRVQDKVKALYTMGSPHAGIDIWVAESLGFFNSLIPGGLLSGVSLDCNKQEGACELSRDSMFLLNLITPNFSDIQYTFISGDALPGPQGVALFPFVGGNDGLVGSYSGVGWKYPDGSFFPTDYWVKASPPNQFWVDEGHYNNIWGSDIDSYFDVPSGYSDTFECIKAIINNTTSEPYCRNAYRIPFATSSLQPIIHQFFQHLPKQVLVN